MRFEYGRFGLKQDPRGAHVTLTYEGRKLLGTVVGFYRDVGARLKVRFMCGDPWPINPVASAVDVLERTYDA